MKDLVTQSFTTKLSAFAKLSRSKSTIRQESTLGVLQLPDTSVSDLLQKEVISTDHHEDSFFIADVGEVYRQYIKWETLFPQVTPFFAIKSNPDPYFLQLLAELGTGFDCASKNEIQQVLNNGVDPSRIIYANPCKPMSHIRFAASVNVRKMTFDNADELRKIKACHPTAQVVLRILTDDSKSVCQFGIKFGASLSSAKDLVLLARELGLDLIGVSFHVGSGCFDAESYCDAIRRARVVFDQATQQGFTPHLLDIGGGFPGAGTNDGSISLEDISRAVHRSMATYFPEGGIELISEPGRYFVSSALTLACCVTSRRVVPRDLGVLENSSDSELASGIDAPTGNNVDLSSSPDSHPSFMYYINDGVYGSFNCIMFDHAVITPRVLYSGGVFTAEALYQGRTSSISSLEFESSVWGPTCDSLDVITKRCSLPCLEVGDWLYFPDMGAYTNCAASEFNGYAKSRVVYTNTSAFDLKTRLGKF